MYTDPCTFALQLDNYLMQNVYNDHKETKFIISGRHERPNGWEMRDELAFISTTKQEAINTCQRLYPDFHIHTVREDHSVPEVVKLQPLR
jgi:hypothetical protein